MTDIQIIVVTIDCTVFDLVIEFNESLFEALKDCESILCKFSSRLSALANFDRSVGGRAILIERYLIVSYTEVPGRKVRVVCLSARLMTLERFNWSGSLTSPGNGRSVMRGVTLCLWKSQPRKDTVGQMRY